MLETINKNQPLNIKDLVIESKNRYIKNRFDPEMDIPDEIKDKMFEYYAATGGRSEQRRLNALHNGLYLQLLFHNLFPQNLLNKLGEEAETYINSYNPIFSDKTNYSYKINDYSPISIIAGIKLFLPNSYDSLKVPYKFIQSIHILEQTFKTTGTYLSLSNSLSNLFGLSILDYQKFIQNTLPKIIPISTEQLATFYNTYEIRDPYNEVALRSFFPNVFEENKNLIPWSDYHDQLKKYINVQYWDAAIPLAGSMAILSAEKVTINETGLNISNPTILSRKECHLPTRRKF